MTTMETYAKPLVAPELGLYVLVKEGVALHNDAVGLGGAPMETEKVSYTSAELGWN